MEQINTGGPGHLDVSVVRLSDEPSWASLQGEWHRVKLKREWTGEQHVLDLGNVINGTLMLEYGFLDIKGYPGIYQTRNISVEASESTIEYESRRIGLRVDVQKQGVFLYVISTVYEANTGEVHCTNSSSTLLRFWINCMIEVVASIGHRSCTTHSPILSLVSRFEFSVLAPCSERREPDVGGQFPAPNILSRRR